MAQRKNADELDHVPGAPEKEDDAEEKQQVVVAGEHVGRTQAHVLQMTRLEHGLPIGCGHSMRIAGRAGKERPEDDQKLHGNLLVAIEDRPGKPGFEGAAGGARSRTIGYTGAW